MFLPYDIIKDLVYIHDRINNLFEERLKSIYAATDQGEASDWSPAADFYETAGEFVLVAEVPGVSAEDLNVEVTDNVLVLRGRRPFPSEEGRAENYRRLEGGYGNFERRFPLTAAVERDSVKAALKNGLLTVTIPKSGGGGVTSIELEDA